MPIPKSEISSNDSLANILFSNGASLNGFTATERACSQCSLLLLLLMLLWLPITKAGMMPGALPILGLFMALILVLQLYPSSRNALEMQQGKPWLVVWMLFSLCVLTHQVIVPYVFGLYRYLPGTTLALPDVVVNSIANGLPGMRVWFYFSIMWVAAWRVSLLNTRNIGALLLVIFLASLFQAIYGLSHFLSGSSSVLGLWEKEYYLKDVTGTFVNRNHFSGMLAICWPIVLSGLLGNKPVLFSRAAKATRWAIAISYSLILIVALVSSHSRMGTVAAFSGVFVFLLIYRRAISFDANTVFARMLPVVAVVFVLLFAVWFGVEDILERYTALEDGDSRTKVWQAMFDLPMSAWLIGIGPGAFEDVFHLVQPDYLRVRFLYAHSDYLEFVLEFGVIGSFLILLTFLYWLWKVFPRGNNALRAGAMGSIAAIALHSIVDFNLQIPGSAVFFWVAVGLVMNPAMVLPEDERDGRVPVRRKMGKKEWLDFFRS